MTKVSPKNAPTPAKISPTNAVTIANGAATSPRTAKPSGATGIEGATDTIRALVPALRPAGVDVTATVGHLAMIATTTAGGDVHHPVAAVGIAAIATGTASTMILAAGVVDHMTARTTVSGTGADRTRGMEAQKRVTSGGTEEIRGRLLVSGSTRIAQRVGVSRVVNLM